MIMLQVEEYEEVPVSNRKRDDDVALRVMAIFILDASFHDINVYVRIRKNIWRY